MIYASQNFIAKVYREVLGLYCLVKVLTCTENCISRCAFLNYAFLNNVQSIQFATGELQSSQRTIKANRMHLTTIWSATAKGLNTMLMRDFSLGFFYKFAQQILKTFFIECRMMSKLCHLNLQHKMRKK